MVKQSLRSCLSCGRKAPKSELLRFVWRRDTVLADQRQRASGRGAYSCDNEQCRAQFLTDKKKWIRAFRLY